MPYTFTLRDVIPATPRAIYEAWLSSRGHSAMTGGKAKQSAKVGAAVTAWGDYIAGRNLKLVPYRRIVQSWRTTRFAAGQPDSKITVTLTPARGGTRIRLMHSNVPDDHKGYEQGGWQTHYFEPMKKYFGRKAKAAAKPKKTKTRKKTAKKRTVKKKAKRAR